jgi:hypothetical protein
MNTEVHAAFEAAKIRRTELTTAVAAATIRASCKGAALLVLREQSATLKQSRANAVASARSADVLRIGDEQMKVGISCEIAVGEDSSSRAELAAAVTALRDTEVEVRKAAEAIVLDEMIDLAGALNASMDRAMEIGAELEALNMREGRPTALGSAPPLPVAVVRALERLPKPNPESCGTDRAQPIGGRWIQKLLDGEYRRTQRIDPAIARAAATRRIRASIFQRS